MYSKQLLAGEGELRIVDRLEVNGFVTGALQVFLDGEFGAVCSKGFDSIDADVACRQMGFIGGKSIDTAIDRTVSVLEQEEQFRVRSLIRLHEYMVEQYKCMNAWYHFGDVLPLKPVGQTYSLQRVGKI